MYDFLEKNSLYVVMFILLAIWVGIFVYLFRLDKRIKKLEQNQQ
jgi:CcmD family protein